MSERRGFETGGGTRLPPPAPAGIHGAELPCPDLPRFRSTPTARWTTRPCPGRTAASRNVPGGTIRRAYRRVWPGAGANRQAVFAVDEASAADSVVAAGVPALFQEAQLALQISESTGVSAGRAFRLVANAATVGELNNRLAREAPGRYRRPQRRATWARACVTRARSRGDAGGSPSDVRPGSSLTVPHGLCWTANAISVRRRASRARHHGPRWPTGPG